MNGEVLSQIELVLPQNVVEAAYVLNSECEAEFRAVNLDTKTSSEIALHKHADLSVRVRITGMFNTNGINHSNIRYCRQATFKICLALTLP